MLMLLGASAAKAQSHPIAVEVAYQLIDFEDLRFPAGLNADISAGVSGSFAVVGEVGWSRNSSQEFGLRDVTTAFDAAGGIRWSGDRRRRFAPFAQVMLGFERERVDIERFGADATTSVLVQPGVGIAARLRTREALFGEIDWRHVPQHSDDHTNALRVLIGVRFNFD